MDNYRNIINIANYIWKISNKRKFKKEKEKLQKITNVLYSIANGEDTKKYNDMEELKDGR